MKKLIAVLIAMIVVFAMAACSPPAPKEEATEAPATSAQQASDEPSQSSSAEASPTEGETAGLPNPVIEVDSADEIMEKTDIFITVPEGAADAKYSIIADEVAQVDFTLDGINYNHRIQKTDKLEDISGVYTDFEVEKDMTWEDYPYQIKYSEGKEGISLWYDDLAGASYSVFMESGADESKLESISIALIPAG